MKDLQMTAVEELSKDEIDKFFVDMVCNSKEEPKQECCQDVSGFYLGTTCSKCNTPFRSVIQEPKQETIEEAIDRIFLYQPGDMSKGIAKKKAIELAKWQAERMYSEEEVLAMLLIKHDGISAEYVLQQFKKK
jgi:hypothetical protein